MSPRERTSREKSSRNRATHHAGGLKCGSVGRLKESLLDKKEATYPVKDPKQ